MKLFRRTKNEGRGADGRGIPTHWTVDLDHDSLKQLAADTAALADHLRGTMILAPLELQEIGDRWRQAPWEDDD